MRRKARLRDRGYSISAQGVRRHMQKGRAGFRLHERWFGYHEDVEKLLEWVGKRRPR